jgi:hypothetical protein
MSVFNLVANTFDDRLPDIDGQPIAENTLQLEWIVTIRPARGSACDST